MGVTLAGESNPSAFVVEEFVHWPPRPRRGSNDWLLRCNDTLVMYCREMRFWWVNQNQTFPQEFGGGYLWSPKRRADGARNQFYQLNIEGA